MGIMARQARAVFDRGMDMFPAAEPGMALLAENGDFLGEFEGFVFRLGMGRQDREVAGVAGFKRCMPHLRGHHILVALSRRAAFCRIRLCKGSGPEEEGTCHQKQESHCFIFSWRHKFFFLA
jgi:hypothetical protein